METEIQTNLLSASSVWKAVSLEKRKAALEKTSLSARANNAQAQTARKALAESTKAFKKCLKSTESVIVSTDEQKSQFQKLAVSCRGIVKSYQEEIDFLTKRCKASDTLITDLQKGMCEAPDPAPLLSNAAEHLESMTGQVTHLLKGMEEMQRELETRGKENAENSKKQDDKLLQVHKLLEEANTKNKKMEKELKNAKSSAASSQNEKSYMSKEEKEELIELRREVAEYEVEFKTLKNQDITIKKLNAKIDDMLENQEDQLQSELK